MITQSPIKNADATGKPLLLVFMHQEHSDVKNSKSLRYIHEYSKDVSLASGVEEGKEVR